MSEYQVSRILSISSVSISLPNGALVQHRANAGSQDKLVTPLSLFLRLYTLLHPARPSDHEHLTFGHLVLPSALQDEVQATDVLRVGRMYEDLIGGGETGKAVLAELVRGETGEDEESEWGSVPHQTGASL